MQEIFVYKTSNEINTSHNIMIRIIINITSVSYVTVYTMYQEHDDIFAN